MAEEKRSSSWEIRRPGPGTISGFLVAWVFVAAIIGLTLILMVIGKGPMPLRVVGYDVRLDGQPPAQASLDKLTAALKQTSAMVVAMHGGSEETAIELGRRLEMTRQKVAAEGSSAILTRYSIEKSEGARAALIQFGDIGRFGVVNVDLTDEDGGSAPGNLDEAVDLAKKEFGQTPHAVLALVGDSPPSAPSGYVAATIEGEEATEWRVYLPASVAESLKDCYVPTKNETVKEYSDRLPVVARFVFQTKDFE